MKLFYISGNSSGTGDNMDLFVHANGYVQAGEHWEKYYEGWDFPPAAKVYALPLPRKGKSGSVNWDELPFLSYLSRVQGHDAGKPIGLTTGERHA